MPEIKRAGRATVALEVNRPLLNFARDMEAAELPPHTPLQMMLMMYRGLRTIWMP